TLSVYILDKCRKLVPNGVIGELYVGGAGVSRGYLGKRELTKAKFIPDPYNPGQRLYRSGDLARVLPSGDIEYIGRMDDQVKIRGFRIELGEIESQLLNHPAVKEAVVSAYEKEGSKYLVAYYVTGKEIETAQLRAFMQARLPDYMVPTYYVYLQSLPLTSNGKLDKKALPAPEIRVVEQSAKPKNHAQKALVKIWSDILSVDESRIGIHTNFFDVGGNSLKLVKMVDKINHHFKSDITVAKVFTYPVIASLAAFLEQEEPAASEPTSDGMQSNLDQMQETINIFNQIQN
ncbi:MAG TPA: non-ribosomal peptide synthetase, partial [Chitinophagaceae bacterium]|nr:non-ribosomal peptide synthetase [Chitinophagaceae bacterium]